MDEQLKQLIIQSGFLSPGDKDFLMTKLGEMSPLDKLKLKHNLVSGQAPAVLQSLQMMRAKFFQSEAPKQPDLLAKLVQNIVKPAPAQIISPSLLSQPQLIGGPVPLPASFVNTGTLNNLEALNSPEQLSLLTPAHVSLGIGANNEQVLQGFFDRLDGMFEPIEDVNVRRNYFMNFLQSPLFSGYIHTGLTALKHLELQPRNIVLNTLYQIDPKYLNNQQFRLAAIICNHLRGLCGL